MPRQVVSVWLWDDGVQIVRLRDDSYVYLSWSWPFVTVYRSKMRHLIDTANNLTDTQRV